MSFTDAGINFTVLAHIKLSRTTKLSILILRALIICRKRRQRRVKTGSSDFFFQNGGKYKKYILILDLFFIEYLLEVDAISLIFYRIVSQVALKKT